LKHLNENELPKFLPDMLVLLPAKRSHSLIPKHYAHNLTSYRSPERLEKDKRTWKRLHCFWHQRR